MGPFMIRVIAIVLDGRGQLLVSSQLLPSEIRLGTYEVPFLGSPPFLDKPRDYLGIRYLGFHVNLPVGVVRPGYHPSLPTFTAYGALDPSQPSHWGPDVIL